MSCPYCRIFACFERQIARRLQTGTLAMSEENAQHLVEMAAVIRSLTRITRRRVENEPVPSLLCDLLGGLADGLMEELNSKLAALGQKPLPCVPFRSIRDPHHRRRNACRAG